MKSWSALPRGTTLVSPVTTLTPAASAARRIELDHAAEHGDVEPLLEDERRRHGQRHRAADGEVVDGAVDGQLADVAPREEERADHEAVGGHGQPRPLEPGDAQHRLVAELGEHGVVEDVGEDRRR